MTPKTRIIATLMAVALGGGAAAFAADQAPAPDGTAQRGMMGGGPGGMMGSGPGGMTGGPMRGGTMGDGMRQGGAQGQPGGGMMHRHGEASESDDHRAEMMRHHGMSMDDGGRGGMMGGGMMQMMDMCRAGGGGMARGGMPRLPPGNAKLQLQMEAEMMQKNGEILARYAAKLADAPKER